MLNRSEYKCKVEDFVIVPMKSTLQTQHQISCCAMSNVNNNIPVPYLVIGRDFLCSCHLITSHCRSSAANPFASVGYAMLRIAINVPWQGEYKGPCARRTVDCNFQMGYSNSSAVISNRTKVQRKGRNGRDKPPQHPIINQSLENVWCLWRGHWRRNGCSFNNPAFQGWTGGGIRLRTPLC